MITKQLHFPTQIYFSDVYQPSELNIELRKLVYSLQAADPSGINHSNVRESGAWHSLTNLHKEATTAALTKQLHEVVTEIYADLGYHPDYLPMCDGMWANVNAMHGYNRHHIHPNVLWSGVYYVQCPDNCGEIHFIDPRIQNQMITPVLADDKPRKAEMWSDIFFHPKEGNIIIFPAWLSHEVRPNMNTGAGKAADRISISFNFYQIHKTQNQ